MKHLKQVIIVYNEVKKLAKSQKLQQAYRKIQTLPEPKSRSSRIIIVNLYAILSIFKNEFEHAIASLNSIVSLDCKTILAGLTYTSLVFAYYKTAQKWNAENSSLKIIPLLEGELQRAQDLKGKKKISKTVKRQLRAMLTFLYLVMIHAACSNNEYKRAYDFILKSKRTNDFPIKKSLERLLKCVKQVYKYKLAFGGLREERSRLLEHHKVISKNLEKQTKYHHQSNEFRGDKLQQKLDSLNRTLIEQFYLFTMEDLKAKEQAYLLENSQMKQSNVKSQPKEKVNEQGTLPIMSKNIMRNRLSSHKLPQSSKNTFIQTQMIRAKSSQRIVSARTRQVEKLYVKKLITKVPSGSAYHQQLINKYAPKLTPENNIVSQQQKNEKALKVLEISQNPIYHESSHPETILPHTKQLRELAQRVKHIIKFKNRQSSVGLHKLSQNDEGVKIRVMSGRETQITSSKRNSTSDFRSKKGVKPSLSKKKKEAFHEKSVSSNTLRSSSDGSVQAELVFVQGEAYPGEEIIEQKLVPIEQSLPIEQSHNAVHEQIESQLSITKRYIHGKVKHTHSEKSSLKLKSKAQVSSKPLHGSSEIEKEILISQNNITNLRKQSIPEKQNQINQTIPEKHEQQIIDGAKSNNKSQQVDKSGSQKINNQKGQSTTQRKLDEQVPLKNHAFSSPPFAYKHGNDEYKIKIIDPQNTKGPIGQETPSKIFIVQPNQIKSDSKDIPQLNSDPLQKKEAFQSQSPKQESQHQDRSEQSKISLARSEKQENKSQQLKKKFQTAVQEIKSNLKKSGSKGNVLTQPSKDEDAASQYKDNIIDQEKPKSYRPEQKHFPPKPKQPSDAQRSRKGSSESDSLVNKKKFKKRGNCEKDSKTSHNSQVDARKEVVRNLNHCLEGSIKFYSVQYLYPKAGTLNCNQILQLFLNEIKQLDEHKQRALSAYIWLLQKCIEENYGENYAEENDASQITLLANNLVIDAHPKYEKEIPFEFDLLVDVTQYFFLWLYRRKFTRYMIRQVDEQ